MSGVLYRTFADICNGYASCAIDGASAYIKHMSFRDRLDIDIVQEQHFNEAVSQGIITEKERLELLKKDGSWGDKEEREMAQQSSYVKSMIDGRKNLPVPSFLAKHNEDIKKEEARLKEMRDKRAQLIGLTAEGFSQKVANDHYISTSFFKDRELSTLLWDFDTFNDFDEDEVDKIAGVYEKNINQVCSEKNIKMLCIQGFFQSYFVLCDTDVGAFFGKPIHQFTFFQTQLGNNALYFKYLYENNDVSAVPDHIKNDPDALIQFLDSVKKGKADVAKMKGSNTDMIGATKADREAIGIQNNRPELPNRRLSMDYFAGQQQK